MMFTCGFQSHNKCDSNVEETGLNSGDGNILSVFGVCNDEFLDQVAQQVKQEHGCESLAGAYIIWGGGWWASSAAATGAAQAKGNRVGKK
jgi:hypothetical protein